jgi:hypothetical protein
MHVHADVGCAYVGRDACVGAGGYAYAYPGNTKGGSISVPLTSCLAGLD